MSILDACDTGKIPGRGSETGCWVRRGTGYLWNSVCERVGTQFRFDRRMYVFLGLAANWPVCTDAPGGTVHYPRSGTDSPPSTKSIQLTRRFECRNSGDVHRALRDREIMTALQVDPEAGTVAEQLAEAHRHLGGDRLFLVEDVVERLPGYPERFRHGRLAQRERRQYVLAQYLARMCRLDGRVLLDHQ